MFKNLIFFIFIIILIIFEFSNKIEGQIYRGEPLRRGPFTHDNINDLAFNVTEEDIGTSHSDKSFTRYQFYFLRLTLRNSVSKFHGYIDFHPRVDEFTTLKIPSSNFLYEKLNESGEAGTWSSVDDGYRISAQLLAAKKVTIYTTVLVDVEVSKPCYANEILSDDPLCVGVLPTTEPMVNYTIIEKHPVSTNETKLVNIELAPKRLVHYESGTFVGSFGIVIQLDRGRIVDAAWDGDRKGDICSKCDNCIDNQCAARYDSMQCDYGNGCQLKVFVAWVGVDNVGRQCQSINKLPSNFQRFASTELQKIGLGLVDDFFYRVTSNNNPNVA